VPTRARSCKLTAGVTGTFQVTSPASIGFASISFYKKLVACKVIIIAINIAIS
jgi:hypothetical protein